MTKTLETLADLNKTGFGKPPPRHGLSLLYWFAHDCVKFDQYGEMVAQCSPTMGEFGFKPFHNQFDNNERRRLLPNVNHPYYEVGNLNAAGAERLPRYVREKYIGNHDGSNKDRIIVSFDYRCFMKVYVTQHQDQSRFDHRRTYCISPDLLRTIKRIKSPKQFLQSIDNPDGVYNFASREHPQETTVIDMSEEIDIQNYMDLPVRSSCPFSCAIL